MSTLIGGTVPSINPPKAPVFGEAIFFGLRAGRGEAVLTTGLSTACVGDSDGGAGAGGVGKDGCDEPAGPLTARLGSNKSACFIQRVI